MSKVILTLSLAALTAVSLTACHRHRRSEVVIGGHQLVVSAQLACPDHQGRLNRVSQAADGQSCTYTGSDGEEVTLTRTMTDGRSAQDLLQAREHELAALVPTPPALSQSGISIASNQTAADGSDHETDHTQIDLPGLHILTDGDRASVRLPGVNINAAGNNAHISTGFGELKNATIDATDGAVRASRRASSRSWVIVSRMPPSAAWRPSRAASSPRARVSSPFDGSSASSTRARAMVAAAKATRWAMPPDSVCG